MILSVSILSYGQDRPGKTKKKNYCTWTGCPLKPDDPAHFDPYYNGHLCENFDPAQVDFSREYLALRTKVYAGSPNELSQTLMFDFGPIWQTHDGVQNGVLGHNYQRIQIHIDKVTVGKKRKTYFVVGESKVNDNVCPFRGTISLLKVFMNDSCIDSKYKSCGDLFASYTFYEDSTKKRIVGYSEGWPSVFFI